MASAGVTITGGKALQRMLRELPGRVANKVNRRAVNVATTPILQAVKDECPVDEGDLRKSQIKKVTSRGTQANGIVGADANYTAQGGKRLTKEERASATGELKVPAKYDHLVAYGHVTPGGATTTPNPYIQRGWDESIGPAQAKYETELGRGVEAEAVKLGGG
jgi:hypothetical protein